MAYSRSIKDTIESVQDLLSRKDSGIQNAGQRVSQLTWMLFFKVVDDRETAKEAAEPKYRSPIPDELRWRNWPTNLDNAFANKLILGLRGLQGKSSLVASVRDIFEGAANYAKDGWILRRAYEYLSEVDLGTPENQHEVASIYDQILDASRDLTPARTHSALTNFMVEQIDPQLGEKILDPACGTGGFLVAAIEHLRRNHKETDADERKIQACIHGFERAPFPHHLCIASLALHGVETFAGIERADALEEEATAVADIILVNLLVDRYPSRGAERDLPAAFRSADKVDLYFYRSMELLRSGGRAAMIVPDGFLSGEGVKTRLKEKLLEECDLYTIVRLPKGVFAPHTSSKTDLLFLTKGKPTRKLWYYQQPLPPGYKAYGKTKPLLVEHLAPLRWWWNKRSETRHAWLASIDEIKARNYDLDIHKPPAAGGEAPSRVLELKLRNFRGFKSLTLPLPKKGPAVLIGENGAGKSTVLDAVAMLLSSFTALASGVPARQADVPMSEGDIHVGAPGASVSATFRVGRGDQFWDINLTRARRSAAPGKEIARQAETLKERILRGRVPSLPILCSYSVNRGLGMDETPRRSSRAAGPIEAYEHAFRGGLGSFQDFLQWFRREEDLENQVRLRGDPSHRNSRLEIVRRALQGFLRELTAERFSNLRIERSADAKEGVLVMEKGKVTLQIEQFSEGERNTLLLVSDLARRLATANPGLEDPLRGEGIVLIDEIDLHLHPAWQRGILPALCNTLPGCQFIVSTHSAQVLSRVHRENVFIFEDFELVKVAPHTYGHDANSILGEAMGVPERPKDITDKIKRASILVEEERLGEAKAALGELETILGEHDVEVVRLRTTLLFLEKPTRD